MVNRPKQQGTAAETELVRWLNDLGWDAHRLAEGGINDEGDIEAGYWNAYENEPGRVVFEVKARERLQVHDALAKAQAKTDAPVILAWRRLVKEDGKKRRKAANDDGGWVFVIGRDDLMRLL